MQCLPQRIQVWNWQQKKNDCQVRWWSRCEEAGMIRQKLFAHLREISGGTRCMFFDNWAFITEKHGYDEPLEYLIDWNILMNCLAKFRSVRPGVVDIV